MIKTNKSLWGLSSEEGPGNLDGLSGATLSPVSFSKASYAPMRPSQRVSCQQVPVFPRRDPFEESHTTPKQLSSHSLADDSIHIQSCTNALFCCLSHGIAVVRLRVLIHSPARLRSRRRHLHGPGAREATVDVRHRGGGRLRQH